MAIACLGLVTFLPLPPLFSLPSFISFISASTYSPALGLYLRCALDFVLPDVLFAALRAAVWRALFLLVSINFSLSCL